MERTAIKKLVKWNESKRRKPLIVWGARQVGKTYLIKDIFAKKHYKNNFLYIDFKIEDEINEFCSKTANAESLGISNDDRHAQPTTANANGATTQ